MNWAISSALAPATTSPFPPLARDCSTSGGPRPCWSSWKPRDGTSPHVREHRLYLLARVLTEPFNQAMSGDQGEHPAKHRLMDLMRQTASRLRQPGMVRNPVSRLQAEELA